MRKSILAASLFGLLSFATPALAEEFSIRVPITEADLQNEQGLAELYGRVAKAAEKACKSEVAYDGLGFAALRSCRRDTVANAIQGSGYAPLIAYHETLTEGAPASTSLALR